VEKKDSNAEEAEEALEEALAGMTTMMAERIKPDKYGAFSTTDEDADGYYIVKWTSEPYTLQEDKLLTEYTPAMRIPAGTLVCDAEYYNKVPGASLWYTPTQGDERNTVVRVQQVVAADLTMMPISDSNKLPAGMSKKNKQEATKQNALRLESDEHDMVLDEIHRREVLEHDEDVESDDDEEMSDEDEDEDEAGEDDDE
jgi:hypothetical protein